MKNDDFECVEASEESAPMQNQSDEEKNSNNIAMRLKILEAKCKHKADYYVKFKIVNKKGSTVYSNECALQTETQNPVWNEEFRLALKLHEHKLIIAMYQKTYKFMIDFVGSTEILAETFTVENQSTILEKKLVNNGRERDTLKISYKIFDEEQLKIKSILWPEQKVVKSRNSLSVQAMMGNSFETKVEIFNDVLREEQSKKQNINTSQPLTFKTTRETLMADVHDAILMEDNDRLIHGEITFNFDDDRPHNWLFYYIQEIKESGVYFRISPKSNYAVRIVPPKNAPNYELSQYEVLGCVIGIAIAKCIRLEAHFIRPIYKLLLDKPLTPQDIETYWGEQLPQDKNGEDEAEVNALNLRTTIKKRFFLPIRDQVEAIKTGLKRILPYKYLKIFDEFEFEFLMCGLPDVDIDFCKSKTIYVDYPESHEVVQWFWEVVTSFDRFKKAKLFQLLTGTSRFCKCEVCDQRNYIIKKSDKNKITFDRFHSEIQLIEFYSKFDLVMWLNAEMNCNEIA